MSKNQIIGLVVAIIIVIVIGLIFIMPRGQQITPFEEDITVPEDDMDFIEEEDMTLPEETAIMELTEEELMGLQLILDEAIPEEMFENPELYGGIIMEVDSKLMELTADELRELTVEDVRQMFEDVQSEELEE